MKKIITTSLLIAAAASAQAAPLVTIGDQLDLFFKGSVIGKWDSNITYSSNQKLSDYSSVFRLGAEADYGRNSKFKANVKFYEDLTRYASKTQFNSNLAHITAKASYVEANYKLDAHFSFDQMYNNTSTTRAVGELVNYNYWTAGANGSYDFSEKLFGELGFNWTKTEYTHKWSEIYSSYDSYSVPLSVLFRVTPKISAGLSYQYRNIEYTGGRGYGTNGSSRDDHFGGVTVRGDILPKLNLSAYAGLTYRDSNGQFSDETTFALNATVSYELTEKVALFATGRRDFGNGAQRQSSIDTGCEVGANYSMNQFVTFTTSFAYLNSDYMSSTRNDDEYIGRIGVNYKPNKFITLGANYRYLNNASNQQNCNYMQHLVDVSVAIKY